MLRVCATRFLMGAGVACFLFATTVFSQEPEAQNGSNAGLNAGLNARDAFWSSADLLGKRPAPRRPVVHSHKTPPPPDSATSAATPKALASTPEPSVNVVDSGTLEKVSVNAPLGLRYAVLKKLSDGTYQEISPDSIFHAGDQIRLSLMSNQEGYLYVIEQGSSGNWVPLYPGKDASPDGNKLSPGKDYVVPGAGAWRFTGEPGQEKLFVLLSRAPETNLDETIASLRNHQGAINDQLVSQLRGEVQSRDLVFTSGDSDASAGNADKANYVVNKASGKTPDPHVVVDVVLSHK